LHCSFFVLKHPFINLGFFKEAHLIGFFFDFFLFIFAQFHQLLYKINLLNLFLLRFTYFRNGLLRLFEGLDGRSRVPLLLCSY